MSPTSSLTRWLPDGRKTARCATFAGLLLLLGAADRPPPQAPARSCAQLVVPTSPPRLRSRAGRRPFGRQKHAVTDQDILDQAQAAYIRGERQHAIDLATSIAEKGGDLAAPAWRFIGLAACSVRANRLASRAYGNLAAPDDQQALVHACQSNGLYLVNNQFIER